MSLIAMINMIGEFRDTRALWMSMNSEQKHLAVEGLTGQEDHKTLLKRLRRIVNKQKHDAAERRRHELNRRLQEILIARPIDRTLIELRASISHVTDEPNPLLRFNQLRQYIALYDARIAEITARNKAAHARTA